MAYRNITIEQAEESVRQRITNNGRKEITGQALQDVLLNVTGCVRTKTNENSTNLENGLEELRTEFSIVLDEASNVIFDRLPVTQTVNNTIYSRAGNNTLGEFNYATALGVGNEIAGDYAFTGGKNCVVGENAAAFNDSNNSTGVSSFACGFGNVASGETSFACGGGNEATGEASHAEGSGTKAYGYSSHAEGDATQAIGNNSHAEGDLSIASGLASHAEGAETTAEGVNSHAEGDSTIASGYNSHAEGSVTVAEGDYSHAEGDSTVAEGDYSHAEGFEAQAIGNYSHAEGYQTKTQGNYSHAEGYKAIAEGMMAHAEGQNTYALGTSSHAGGSYSIAMGNQTFAHGVGVSTSNTGEAAFGSYNETKEGLIFSIGAGNSNESRKNVLEVYSNGNIFIYVGNERVRLQDCIAQVANSLGDLNNDSEVNSEDFAAINQLWDNGQYDYRADLNNDNKVDKEDVDILKSIIDDSYEPDDVIIL